MGRIGVEIATRGETFPLVGEDGRSDERRVSRTHAFTTSAIWWSYSDPAAAAVTA